MSDNLDFEVIAGCVISSSSSDFEVQSILGSGTFGEVAQCRKAATDETVALKVLKDKDCIEEAQQEVTILKILKRLHCEKYNIVQWIDSFDFQGRFCLEFEKLDISLYEFLKGSPHQSLSVVEIRPIVQQLATALEFLGSAGIVHADLKLENIMMVDHVQQPLKVKVIDFGLATYRPAACTGYTLQTLWYRSPEVLLGAPFDEAIDIWSLGCIAAQLLMGIPLFPGIDEYDLMRHIIYAVGQPPDQLLNTGLYSALFFSLSYTEEGQPIWSFKPTLEPGQRVCNPRSVGSLNDLMCGEIYAEDDAAQCDQAAFVQLLTEMLKVDAAERITASSILQHPFISMSHLTGPFDNSLYLNSSLELMGIELDVCYGDGDDLVQETLSSETSDSSSSTEDDSVPEEDHPAEPTTSCEQPATPNTDTSTTPNTDTSTTPNTDASTTPNTDTSTTPNTDTSTTPNTDTSTTPNTDTSTTSNTNTSTPPNTDTSTTPNTGTSTTPNTDTSTSPNTDTSTSPNTDTSTTSNTDTSTPPGKKRKRSADGDPEGAHRSPDDPPASKRRNQSALLGTGGQVSSHDSVLCKRKREDAEQRDTPDEDPSVKRRCIGTKEGEEQPSPRTPVLVPEPERPSSQQPDVQRIHGPLTAAPWFWS